MSAPGAGVRVVASALLTAAVVTALAAAWLLFLLLAMNGFTEAQARPVFVGYFALAALCVAVSAVVSGWGASALPRALGWPGWVAATLTSAIATVGAAAALFAGSILLLLAFSP